MVTRLPWPKILGAIGLAFVLTSAAMFWILYFQSDLGSWVTDRATPYYGGSDVIDGYYSTLTPGTDKLKQRSPLEERALLDDITSELKATSDSDLIQMKAFSDVCSYELVDCRGLPSVTVKPFIESVLDDRRVGREAGAAYSAHSANLISGGSLFVAFIALMFTGLTYRRNNST